MMTFGNYVTFITLNDGSSMISENIKADMDKLLIEKAKKLGHEPTFSEVEEDPKMPPPNSYAYYHGSFREAARFAWSMARRKEIRPQPAVTAEVKTLKQVETEVKTKVSKSLPKDRWPRKYISDETVVVMMRNFYDKHGRLPKMSDTRGNPELPSWPVINRALGLKKTWAKKLGIEEKE